MSTKAKKTATKPSAKRAKPETRKGTVKKTANKKAGSKTKATKKTATKKAATKPPATHGSSAAPKLLSGGNPQIPKGDGDAPVQSYIAAMPGWKHDVGRQLDALVEQTVPRVRKAVRWNSPFYGIEGQGWFLSFHCFTKYIKLTFLRGAALRPLPPGESKHPDVRYLDIYEDDPLDQQLKSWIRQASEHPGENLF